MTRQPPTQEQLRAWLVWNEADGHFWWVRNPARRVRARRAGYRRAAYKRTWMIRVGGMDWSQQTIKDIYFDQQSLQLGGRFV